MKYDFWMDLPKCLLDIRKEEATEEELSFVENLENSYLVYKILFNINREFLFWIKNNLIIMKKCRHLKIKFIKGNSS